MDSFKTVTHCHLMRRIMSKIFLQYAFRLANHYATNSIRCDDEGGLIPLTCVPTTESEQLYGKRMRERSSEQIVLGRTGVRVRGTRPENAGSIRRRYTQWRTLSIVVKVAEAPCADAGARGAPRDCSSTTTARVALAQRTQARHSRALLASHSRCNVGPLDDVYSSIQITHIRMFTIIKNMIYQSSIPTIIPVQSPPPCFLSCFA